MDRSSCRYGAVARTRSCGRGWARRRRRVRAGATGRLRRAAATRACVVNHKSVYRLYREPDCSCAGAAQAGVWPGSGSADRCRDGANERWSMDFTATLWRTVGLPNPEHRGRLHARVPGDRGRPLAARERVVRVLERLARARPAWHDRRRQRTGVRGRALDPWAYERGVTLHFIDPASRSRTLRRELQREVPGRVPERALVRDFQDAPRRSRRGDATTTATGPTAHSAASPPRSSR